MKLAQLRNVYQGLVYVRWIAGSPLAATVSPDMSVTVRRVEVAIVVDITQKTDQGGSDSTKQSYATIAAAK